MSRHYQIRHFRERMILIVYGIYALHLGVLTSGLEAWYGMCTKTTRFTLFQPWKSVNRVVLVRIYLSGHGKAA